MIGIYGPARPRRLVLTVGLKVAGMPAEPPLMVSAATLGDALNAYSREFDVILSPYDGSNPLVPFVPGEEPKFFVHTGKDGLASPVDVHVDRGSESICCKQRLDFPLQEGDVVGIGELAC
jgi:hypothetical protein